MTEPNHGGTAHDHEFARGAAALLRRELARPSTPGSPADVTVRTNTPAAAFGSWDAAGALAGTAARGHAEFTAAYRLLFSEIRTAAEALERSAETVQDAEDDNVDRVGRVRELLDGGPKAGGASPDGGPQETS
ncbi:hypothetical protein [Actinomadura rupiterrae]|uniref:hypothetical protein n=1 Tax=Actinomadura rupiterrae TaxID=559627 RepID=UPI0020A407E9|nr:hypothetical protein [Actinomadura rupiterrae]MCP2339975.1 hypothetical protein [Actinomadura rupiterrae]